MLTDSHKALIRNALRNRTAGSTITPEQRLAIREICVERMPITQPDTFLRAFVDAIVEAANAEGIPYGVERDALLSKLVSTFVEELRATTDEEVGLELKSRRVTPTSVARLVLHNESGNTT